MNNKLNKNTVKNKIVDNGCRTHFKSGGMREIDESKGRCDLVYNTVFGEILKDDVFTNIENFIRKGDRNLIIKTISLLVDKLYSNWQEAYLDISKHYANGAAKYVERNMEKGLPFHSMIDSALRHYVKVCRRDEDENHKAAVLWNLITLVYMIDHKPEMNDLPYKNKTKSIPVYVAS